MVTQGTILTCDTLTHSQHLKKIHVLEIKIYFQNEQKSDAMVVLPTPQLRNRKAMSFK